MTMTEFQDRIIRVSIKTQIVVMLAIAGGVSSFWAGVGIITSKQNMVIAKIDSVLHRQEIRDLLQDRETERNAENIKSILTKVNK